jgi:hypothetical protein
MHEFEQYGYVWNGVTINLSPMLPEFVMADGVGAAVMPA